MDDQPAPWTWLDLLRAVGFALGIVVAFALLAAAGVVANRFLLPHGWLRVHLSPLRPYAPGIVALLITLLLYGAALLGIHRYTIRKYRLPWSALNLRPAGWSSYLAMPALYFPMQVGGMLILAGQNRLLGATEDTTQRDTIAMIAQAHWFNYVAVFLAAAVIAPIAEEIMFRGFLYRLLRKRLPTWAAVLISAALFSVLHGIPPLIPMLFFLGVVFALVVERTRSLYCSIILHALQNSVALCMILLAIKLEAGH